MALSVLDEYRLLPRDLTQIKRCTQCGSQFKELENMGRHHCRIHPGIKLHHSGTNRLFYSCCGYCPEASHPGGCLELDHNTLALSITDQNERLAQLQAFATQVVPHLLLAYYKKPLQESILYDSARYVRSPQNLFEARFDVLNKTALTYSNSPFGSSLYYHSENSAVTVECDYSLTLDLNAIQSTLMAKRHESPLLNTLLSKEKLKRDELLRECEMAWPSTLKPKSMRLEEKRVEEVDSERDSIPFVIISRLDKRLEFKF